MFKTSGLQDVVRLQLPGQADGAVDLAGQRDDLAAGLESDGRNGAAQTGNERASLARHRGHRNQPVVDPGVDDQRRQLSRSVRVRVCQQQVAQFTVLDFDTVLTFGGKPASIETLRADDDLFCFLCRPVQVFIHRFLGQAADDSRRDEDDERKHNQQRNNALFHGNTSRRFGGG